MSLFDTLLAALSGAPIQGTRQLRLSTPLGPDVLLAEQLDLTEAIGPNGSNAAPAGLQATVHALAADTHLELKQLMGQPVLVQLAQADASLRAWHGHVTQAALLGSDGGLARYRLRVEPWLAFLGQRQDSWVFQDQSVPDIVDELFADYAGQGKLVPAWRWDLTDRSVYPRRSLCIQYQETDLAFVQRLLREEGLFCWWEHSAATTDASLGAHTLVIADHNGAFKTDLGTVRYTQAVAGLHTDSLDRWARSTCVAAARIEQASPDYRSLSLRPVQQLGQRVPNGLEGLALIDVPGAYAYESSTQGERLALCQMQALDAQREQVQARGTLRAAAPGALLTLTDHPIHDGLNPQRDRHVILSARHQARSNLHADLKAQVHSLLGAIALDAAGAPAGNDQHPRPLQNASDTPVYQTQLRLQRHAVPVRMAGLDADLDADSEPRDPPDVRLSPRPSVHGVQTAVVVGGGDPIHTDRDHRIKIQFHWQRGANASHRLSHNSGSNAPASDASGTWVRVAQSVAGANWGANFLPRVGQEVLIGFVGGDIDRPVVLGSVYNGQGQPDAQANQAAGGAAGSTGNAPAWFPGSQTQPSPPGSLQAHQHPAVLAGHKSQELASSQGGTGGHNQLVFDDSPGAGRIELATTSAQTRLQLGHLLQQTDNRRLQPRGHGLDLTTQAWGAVRAGSGLLLSTHGRSASSGAHIDTREPQAQLQQSQQLLHTLAESAQQHKAQLSGEPEVIGAKQKDTTKQLPVEQGLWASQDSLKATEQRGEAGDGAAANGTAANGTATIGGGTGTVAAWGRPDLVLASPAGIGLHTPALHLVSAGATASLTAGQDIEHAAQAQHSTVAKSGLVLYTYGKTDNQSKPTSETGIRLHAASGNVNTQSQSAATRLTADKAIEVASTQAMVKITAPQHVLLTAAGAAIDIRGGNITLKGPGKVEFKGAMKELAGAGSAQAEVALKKPSKLAECASALASAGASGASAI